MQWLPEEETVRAWMARQHHEQQQVQQEEIKRPTRSPSLDQNEEDEEQTTQGEQRRWEAEYDKMKAEEQAEAQYLARTPRRTRD